MTARLQGGSSEGGNDGSRSRFSPLPSLEFLVSLVRHNGGGGGNGKLPHGMSPAYLSFTLMGMVVAAVATSVLAALFFLIFLQSSPILAVGLTLAAQVGEG